MAPGFDIIVFALFAVTAVPLRGFGSLADSAAPLTRRIAEYYQ